jgi:hypothetical protein
VNAPLHFKQQLADELNARATVLTALDSPSGHRTPVRTRPPRRRLALTLGAVAAAAAVAVAVPLAARTATAPTPHRSASTGTGLDIVTADYAVKTVPGGTIAVRVMSPKGIPGLQAALRKAGVPATVLGFSASCHTKVDFDNDIDPQQVFPQAPAGSGLDGHYALFRLSAVPQGEHLLFMATTAPDGHVGTLQIGVVRQVPGCVPESYNDIGAGYVAPGTNP